MPPPAPRPRTLCWVNPPSLPARPTWAVPRRGACRPRREPPSLADTSTSPTPATIGSLAGPRYRRVTGNLRTSCSGRRRSPRSLATEEEPRPQPPPFPFQPMYVGLTTFSTSPTPATTGSSGTPPCPIRRMSQRMGQSGNPISRVVSPRYYRPTSSDLPAPMLTSPLRGRYSRS